MHRQANPLAKGGSILAVLLNAGRSGRNSAALPSSGSALPSFDAPRNDCLPKAGSSPVRAGIQSPLYMRSVRSKAARLFWPTRRTACSGVCRSPSVFHSSQPSVLPATNTTECSAVGHRAGGRAQHRGEAVRADRDLGIGRSHQARAGDEVEVDLVEPGREVVQRVVGQRRGRRGAVAGIEDEDVRPVAAGQRYRAPARPAACRCPGRPAGCRRPPARAACCRRRCRSAGWPARRRSGSRCSSCPP